MSRISGKLKKMVHPGEASATHPLTQVEVRS
jgi:hypothetical protein